MTTRPSGSESLQEPSGDERLDEDLVFNLLCNDRRRRAVKCLLHRNETDLQDLVSYVTETESDRKSVYVSLRQHHLPRLVEEGIVRFDTDAGTVEPTPSIRTFRPILECTVDGASTGVSTRGSGGREPTGDGPDPAAEPQPEPRDDGGDDSASTHPPWVLCYAGVCVFSWLVAMVDAFDLVNYEFITTGEWAVVFLLILSVFIVMNVYEDYRSDWDWLPAV